MRRWPARHLSVESQFYAELQQRLALTDMGPKSQYDHCARSALNARVTPQMKTRTRDGGSDVCFAPALNLKEAPRHWQH